MTKNPPDYNRQYYQSHKLVYKLKYNAKKHCQCCDKWISGSNFADHLKTQAHLRKACQTVAAK